MLKRPFNQKPYCTKDIRGVWTPLGEKAEAAANGDVECTLIAMSSAEPDITPRRSRINIYLSEAHYDWLTSAATVASASTQTCGAAQVPAPARATGVSPSARRRQPRRRGDRPRL